MEPLEQICILAGKKAPDAILLRLARDKLLDYHVAAKIGEELDSHIKQRYKLIVLGMQQVVYVGSNTLVKFIEINKKQKQAGRGFALLNPTPEVSEVFRITRFDQVLNIYQTVDDLLSAHHGLDEDFVRSAYPLG